MSGISTRRLDAALGYLILRATLGLNIFIHGLSRIIAGPANFAHSLMPMFEHTFLPARLVYVFGLCLPSTEAIAGGLVLIGICTRYALIAGAFLIFNLTFGATLRQDWESAGYNSLMSPFTPPCLRLDRATNFRLMRISTGMTSISAAGIHSSWTLHVRE